MLKVFEATTIQASFTKFICYAWEVGGVCVCICGGGERGGRCVHVIPVLVMCDGPSYLVQLFLRNPRAGSACIPTKL